MKYTISLQLLSALICVTLLFAGCKKELTHTDNTTQQSAEDMRLAHLIKGFKARGESGFKSAAEMTVDSAIWFIGATANFTYGDGSRETERTWTDSLFVTLPVNNGKISEGEVYTKYEAVIDSLREIYQGWNEENKQLLAVTVTTHSLDAAALVCKITGVFAYGFINNNCSFNDIDSWFFWWQVQAGICSGPNYNTNLLSDAAEETQRKIMACKAVPTGNWWIEPLPNNSGIIPLNDPLAYPINPAVAISNYRYAHLYWNSSEYPNFEGCINPGDLNFYLSKTKELIYNDTDHEGVRPVGSSLIDIDMWGAVEVEYNYTIYLHKATVNYGILHVGVNPPNPL